MRPLTIRSCLLCAVVVGTVSAAGSFTCVDGEGCFPGFFCTAKGLCATCSSVCMNCGYYTPGEICLTECPDFNPEDHIPVNAVYAQPTVTPTEQSTDYGATSINYKTAPICHNKSQYKNGLIHGVFIGLAVGIFLSVLIFGILIIIFKNKIIDFILRKVKEKEKDEEKNEEKDEAQKEAVKEKLLETQSLESVQDDDVKVISRTVSEEQPLVKYDKNCKTIEITKDPGGVSWTKPSSPAIEKESKQTAMSVHDGDSLNPIESRTERPNSPSQNETSHAHTCDTQHPDRGDSVAGATRDSEQYKQNRDISLLAQIGNASDQGGFTVNPIRGDPVLDQSSDAPQDVHNGGGPSATEGAAQNLPVFDVILPESESMLPPYQCARCSSIAHSSGMTSVGTQFSGESIYPWPGLGSRSFKSDISKYAESEKDDRGHLRAECALPTPPNLSQLYRNHREAELVDTAVQTDQFSSNGSRYPIENEDSHSSNVEPVTNGH